jgi:hypothetical protein
MSARLLTSKPVSGSIRERHYDVSAGDNTWVQFDDDEGDQWAGVFGNGGVSPYCAVLPFDDELNEAVLVIAGGQGYIVDTVTGTLIRKTPWFYANSGLAAPGRDFVAVANTTEIWVVRRDGDVFVDPQGRSRYETTALPGNSHRLALDGIVFEQSTHDQLVGALWEHDGWYRFLVRYDGLVFEKREMLAKEMDAFVAKAPQGGFPSQHDYRTQMERYRK